MIRHRSNVHWPTGKLCRRIAGCAVAVATLLAVRPAGAATPAEVDNAITNAQQWLIKQQGKGGTWETRGAPKASGGQTDLEGRQWGGSTAIATYALLASGMNAQDAQIKPAVQFLEHANIISTYGLGLSAQIVLPEYNIPSRDLQPLLKRDVVMLFAGLTVPPNLRAAPASWKANIGFYGYWTGGPNGDTKATFGPNIDLKAIGTHQPGDWYDRSNSQYGVLGMWALEQAGGEVPSIYWQIVDAAWKKAQHPDGGWNYNNEANPPTSTPSMTAAGVATLFITQDYTLNIDLAACKGGIRNEFIERGLSYMDKHINEALTGGSFYTMYGVERIGTASGRKYFGTKDWYQIGADYLVKNQHPDGSWAGQWGPLPDTAYALIFLARGRAPVLMNKLQYADPPNLPKSQSEVWNERPRDVANLARWTGRQNERYFNWQVVNLKVAPEELHDAPILYISGSNNLDFKPEEIDKLRTFAEQGGLILGNADCNREIFTKSFEKLGHELFPRYEFKQIAPNDLIWKEQFNKWRMKPKVLELSNGVRKLMVLMPDYDPSRAWQARADTNREVAFQLGASIFLYAVDKKNMQNKGQTYIVKPDPKIQTVRQIKVARLDIGDNPDPEPAGWARLAAIMHNVDKIDLKTELVKPDKLRDFKIADLTGTGRLQLSAAQRENIRKFVTGGGTLIVDAAGGDELFADSVAVELGDIFPRQKLAVLPPDHPAYTQPQVKITQVGWREFAIDKLASRKDPKIEGVRVGNRIGVFFSRHDISAGLVGEPVDGIFGYDSATATKLMQAMLLYASPAPLGTEPAATAPAAPSAPDQPGGK